MTEEEQKAIKILECFLKEYEPFVFYTKQRNENSPYVIKYDTYKTILNLIQERDKQIDLMAKYLAIVRDCPNEDKGANLDCEKRCSNDDNIYTECWKIYFKNKAEEEG